MPKRKQRLYNRFLKNRNEKKLTEYKNFKNLFEAIKKRSKKNNFSKLILTFIKHIKKIWEIIKDSNDKCKCKNQNFSKKVIVDNIAIADETQIAEILISFSQKLVQNLPKN